MLAVDEGLERSFERLPERLKNYFRTSGLSPGSLDHQRTEATPQEYESHKAVILHLSESADEIEDGIRYLTMALRF